MMDLPNFLNSLTQWVNTKPEVVALAYVGSYARRTADNDSDLDIMILSSEPQTLQQHFEWVTRSGVVKTVKAEDWGAVKTWRVGYEDGSEVKFNIGEPSWAETEPVDPGTI